MSDVQGASAPAWSDIQAMMAQDLAAKSAAYANAGVAVSPSGSVQAPAPTPIALPPGGAVAAIPPQAAPDPTTNSAPSAQPSDWAGIQSMMKNDLSQKNAAYAAAAGSDAALNGPVDDVGYLKDSAVRGLRDAYTGITNIGGFLGRINPINMAANALTDAVAPAGTMPIQAKVDALHDAGNAQVGQALAPLVSGAQPSDEPMRMLGQGIEGAVGSAPFALLPGGALPALAGGGLGGIAGEGAAATAKAAGLGDTGQTVARIAGGLLGSLGGGVSASKVAASTAPGVARLADAGITSLTPDLLDKFANTSLANAATLKGYLPFSQAPINAASANAVGQYSTAMGSLADQIGPAVSPTAIGTQVQGSISNWLNDFKNQAAQKYSTAEASVPTGTTITPTNTLDQLGLQAGSKGKLVMQPTTAVQQTMVPPQLADLRDAFLSDGTANLSYTDLKALRSDVGNRLTNAAIISDPSQGALKQLYGSLSDDLRTAVAKGGQPALDAFDNANKFYADGLNTIQTRIGNLAKDGVTPEAVYSQLTTPLAKGATRLTDLYNSGVITDSDLGLIARQQISKLGQTADGAWSPTQFFNNYSKMQANAPETGKLLFSQGLSPDTAAQFDNLASIAGKLQNTETAAGQMNAGAAQKSGLRFLLSKVGDSVPGLVVGGAASKAGAVAGGAAGVAGLGASYALGRLFTSQPFLRFLSKPVTNDQAFAAGLNSLSKMNPDISGDLNTISSQIQNQQSQ